MAEHAALYAAHAVDAGPEDAPLAVAVAKAKAGDMAGTATGAMIQYHGGIGYTGSTRRTSSTSAPSDWPEPTERPLSSGNASQS